MLKRLVTSVSLVLAIVSAGSAQPEPGSAASATLAGTITDPTGLPLPGVIVSVLDARGRSSFETTDPDGRFAFEGLSIGTCILSASLAGYDTYGLELEMVDEEEEAPPLDITLQLAPISETVMIREPRASESGPETSADFARATLDALPLPTDRFQEAMPLIPGVVRDPQGRISFNGTRPSQSMLLVNGANATDPVTGEFSVELPLKAIDEVEVNTLPYSAEYGRLTGAVARVKTRGGSDEFDIDVGNFWPKPNFRDGTIKGLRTFVPQMHVSGPLKKGRAWFSQGLAYRYVRSRAFDVTTGGDETILENFDSFSQLDIRLAKNHQLTTTFSFFPVEVDNLGLNAVTTVLATPDFESSGWNVAFSERATWSHSILETVLSVKSFDVKLDPKAEDLDARFTPEGLRNNYFNRLERDSHRFELASSLTIAPRDFGGQHVLKLGGNLTRSSFTGLDRSLPIDIYANGVRTQRIEFEGSGEIDGRDTQLSLFVQDKYQPVDRLGVDIGLRYDYDRLVDQHQLGPRLSVAMAIDSEGHTVVKAGFGVFFDHVFLHADGYERYQKRTETRFGSDGLASGSPLTFVPRVSDEGLEAPRSTTWNAEINQILRENVRLRLNYRERRGSNEMLVDRVPGEGQGVMLLSSEGESHTREFDATLKLSRNDNELFVSYARARTTGDLNNFGELYQNVRSPLFLDNERSLGNIDVPHRALMWGVWRLAYDIIVSPGIEWRSGFPYTLLDESYLPVGERNRGGRFPNFLSLDLRVTKGFQIKKRKVRLGFQLFNIGSHRNPRDVINNLASPRYGEFLNSVDMGFSLRFSLGS